MGEHIPPPVRLWLVDLDDDLAPEGDALTQGLSRDERERAARRRSPDDARRWALSRYALRQVIAECQGVDADSVDFRAGEAGKPSLAGTSELSFSLAHSLDRALIAVSRVGEVGVDVERVRPGLSETAIIERILGVAGREAWERAALADRTATFFRLWVRHEAAVKCRGVGLVAAIGQDVGVGLAVTDVDAGDGYAAAWAIDATVAPPSAEVSRYRWTDEVRDRVRRGAPRRG